MRFKQQANGEVVPHAPYHIPVGGHQALRVVSGALRGSRRVGVRLGPNSGPAGGNRMYALYSIRSPVNCFPSWAFHLAPYELLPISRWQLDIWRGKILIAWACSASDETPLAFSRLCSPFAASKKLSSPAAIPSGDKNSATRRRSCSA